MLLSRDSNMPPNRAVMFKNLLQYSIYNNYLKTLDTTSQAAKKLWQTATGVVTSDPSHLYTSVRYDTR